MASLLRRGKIYYAKYWLGGKQRWVTQPFSPAAFPRFGQVATPEICNQRPLGYETYPVFFSNPLQYH